MIRKIYCEKCSVLLGPLHPEDVADGWQIRQVNIKAKKPAEHFIVLNGVREDLPVMLCDLCNGPIPDGSKAVAVTQWRGPEPARWESAFGEVD